MNRFGNLLKKLEQEQKNRDISKDVPVFFHKKENSNSDIVEANWNPVQESKFSVPEFESLLRKKLIEDKKRYTNYKRPYISVGELLDCPKKVFFSRMKYPIDLEKEFQFAYLYMILEVGTKIHEIIQDICKFDVVEKTLISKKYGVKGRCDAITKNTLFEFKTIDKNKFKNTYVEDHFLQGSIYSYILTNELNYKIDNICIVYVFRDLRTIKTFDLKPDFKKAENLLCKATVIKSAIKSNVPPPKTNDKSKCTFCQYKKNCKSKQNMIDNFSDSSMIDLM